MADKPKTAKVKLTNRGEGPRSFFDAEGGQHILRPGDSWEGEILEVEKGDLSADLEAGSGGSSSGGSKPNAKPEIEFKSLDGLDRDGLIAIAAEEGYPTIAAQPELSEDEIRKAIELARESTVAGVRAEADALVKSNSAAQLRELAEKEGVPFETDDNKADLGHKLAYKRYQDSLGKK